MKPFETVSILSTVAKKGGFLTAFYFLPKLLKMP
jgi:hypothetical protein